MPAKADGSCGAANQLAHRAQIELELGRWSDAADTAALVLREPRRIRAAEDERGEFDWAAPDAEVHAYANDLERRIGTYVYGRRSYETMVP